MRQLVTARTLCAPSPTVISRVNAIFLGTEEDSLCLLLTQGNNWLLLTGPMPAILTHYSTFYYLIFSCFALFFFGFYFSCSPFSRGRTLEQWWQRPPQSLPACFWVQGTVSNILPWKDSFWLRLKNTIPIYKSFPRIQADISQMLFSHFNCLMSWIKFSFFQWKPPLYS